MLETLAKPSCRGAPRVAGVNLENRRMQAVSEAVLALAAAARGFTARDLSERVHQQQGRALPKYTARKAAYDPRKLRGKALIERIKKTRRYRVRRPGIRTLAGLYILREKSSNPCSAAPAAPNAAAHPK